MDLQRHPRSLHHTTKNVPIRYQFTYFARNIDAFKHDLHAFLKRCTSSSNFLFVRLDCLMPFVNFVNLHFSPIIQF